MLEWKKPIPEIRILCNSTCITFLKWPNTHEEQTGGYEELRRGWGQEWSGAGYTRATQGSWQGLNCSLTWLHQHSDYDAVVLQDVTFAGKSIQGTQERTAFYLNNYLWNRWGIGIGCIYSHLKINIFKNLSQLTKKLMAFLCCYN